MSKLARIIELTGASRWIGMVQVAKPADIALGALGFASQFGNGVTDLCFPPTCVFCHGVMDWEREIIRDRTAAAVEPLGGGFCVECRSLIAKSAIHHACRYCGQVLPASEVTGITTCKGCSKQPGPIERVVALGAYQQVLREAVVASKRMGYSALSANLGDLLGLKIREAFDGLRMGAVTYIPSHWSRRLRRGGVPTIELARRVARVIDCPCVPLLTCVRRTEKQGMLTDKQRRKNVQGAFIARKGYALKEPRILIVDDVWTTGSTVREAAKGLRQGYDAEVYAAVVARAVGTHT